MKIALTENWGNPSSLHEKGVAAQSALDNARFEIASRVGCEAEEIIFTSGGTEGNNLALLGAANAHRRGGRKIITTSVEHPSVEEPLKILSQEGFNVVRLPVNSFGRISERDLVREIDSETILISLMAVNNETGTIQPVEAARQAVKMKRSPALIHCDAVQAFGKLKVKPAAMGVDLMTISAHKIHGPKGAGALYIKKGTTISPRTFGGSQERALRPGTEPMPAIVGFGAAASALGNIQKELEKAARLRDYMVAELKKIGGIAINSPPEGLPFVTSISVLGKRSEPMLNFLSARNVFVSSGSACSRGHKSRVLKAMGLSEERLNSPLRISISRYTETEHINMLLEGIREGKRQIRD